MVFSLSQSTVWIMYGFHNVTYFKDVCILICDKFLLHHGHTLCIFVFYIVKLMIECCKDWTVVK